MLRLLICIVLHPCCPPCSYGDVAGQSASEKRQRGTSGGWRQSGAVLCSARPE
jgi:hypothetical protein